MAFTIWPTFSFEFPLLACPWFLGELWSDAQQQIVNSSSPGVFTYGKHQKWYAKKWASYPVPPKKKKKKKNDMQVAGGIKMTKFHDDFFEGWCNFHFNYLKLKMTLLQHEIMSATSLMIQAQMTVKNPCCILSSSGHRFHKLIKYLGPLAALNSYLEENLVLPWCVGFSFPSIYIPYFCENRLRLSDCPKPGIWTSSSPISSFPSSPDPRHPL